VTTDNESLWNRTQGENVDKPLQKITKTYPKKGPLSQFRFEKVVSFVCFRCRSSKTSKLISLYSEDWSKKLCNGCYGRLISLYEIRSKLETNENLSALEKHIHQMWSQYQKELSNIELEISKKYSYESATNKFLATAEYLKRNLPDDEFLEWSPAIICLCKAVENELIHKFINPLKTIAKNEDLTSSNFDKRTQNIEKYIFGAKDTPPEVGGVAFFTELLAKSQNFRASSPTLQILKIFSAKRPFASWFYSENGASKPLSELVKEFRNKAAHISDLTRQDFLECEKLTLMSNGILEKIVTSAAER